MKYLKQILMILVLALCLCGCSKGGKDITVDVDALANELQSQAVTSDTLASTVAEMIPSIYFIDAEQMEKGVAYTSTGATACEVAVIQCKKASQTGDVEKLFKNRMTSQSELFASYNAGEVSKLEKAIIKSAGSYVVLCVCDDTAKAEEILKKYGF